MEIEFQCFLEVEAPPWEGPAPLPLELDPQENGLLSGGLVEGKGKSFKESPEA